MGKYKVDIPFVDTNNIKVLKNDEMLELFKKYEPLMEKCLGVLNPVGIKALMNALNLPAGDLRLPLKEEAGLEEELYALWS